MHPELFRIPFTSLTVKGYGLMLVIGFLLAVHVIRRLSRNITPDPQMITNASLYSLVAGVIGSRIFYILHHFDNFKDNLKSVFKIWQGGLELLGGVIGAIGGNCSLSPISQAARPPISRYTRNRTYVCLMLWQNRLFS